MPDPGDTTPLSSMDDMQKAEVAMTMLAKFLELLMPVFAKFFDIIHKPKA